MPAGRPEVYTPELADEICALLSDGISMRKICEEQRMPSRQTIFTWFRTHPEFADQYARAKEECAESFVEDILDIADNSKQDWIVSLDDEGEEITRTLNTEHIQRSRLRVDSRKWLASKLKPKKYGDKIQTEHSGNLGLTDLTDVGLAERLAELRAEKAKLEK